MSLFLCYFFFGFFLSLEFFFGCGLLSRLLLFLCLSLGSLSYFFFSNGLLFLLLFSSGIEWFFLVNLGCWFFNDNFFLMDDLHFVLDHWSLILGDHGGQWLS